MKKTIFIPEVRVVKLEAVDIVTSSSDSGIRTLSMTGGFDEGSDKSRGRNSVWDD